MTTATISKAINERTITMYRITWTGTHADCRGEADALYASREHALEIAALADKQFPEHVHVVVPITQEVWL